MQLDPSSFYGSLSANGNISQMEGRIDSIKFPQVEAKKEHLRKRRRKEDGKWTMFLNTP